MLDIGLLVWYSVVMDKNTPHTTVVFSDMHNRDFVVKDLFRKIGLMDEDGKRADGFRTIQLGDLLSLGYGEQEAEFLKWVRPFIDEQLVGNHELPAFTPYSDYVEFVGWDKRDIVAEQLVRAEFTKARMEDDPSLWVAATNVGKWLITHAGASVAVQKEMLKEGWDGTAVDAADYLNDLWLDHIINKTPDPIIIGTGQQNGGIFWHRIQYLRAGYCEKHVPQIVGHTPFDHNQKFSPPSVQNRDGNLVCIDTPGSCCAMITKDDGETWDIVTSDYETKYGNERQRGEVFGWDKAIDLQPLKLGKQDKAGFYNY